MTPLHLTLCNGLPYELVIEHPITVWEGNPPEPIRDELTTSIINPHHLNHWEYCKPILRRLSDLDKEITHNGEKFIPAEVLWAVSENDIDNFLLYKEVPNYWQEMMRNDIKKWDFGDVQMILKWHFNVFNLPDSDFIPVTNEFNPY